MHAHGRARGHIAQEEMAYQPRLAESPYYCYSPYSTGTYEDQSMRFQPGNQAARGKRRNPIVATLLKWVKAQFTELQVLQ